MLRSLRRIPAALELAKVLGCGPGHAFYAMGLLKIIIGNSKERASALCNGEFDLPQK